MARTICVKKLIITALGSLLGIGAVTYFSSAYDAPLLIASFGASAVIIYGMPASPVAKPRNVFFGHLFSSIIGVAAYAVWGSTWYAMTAAVTLAIVVMTLTETLHPPGGATALVCVMSRAAPSFIAAPVMAGVVVLMIVAWSMNQLSKKYESS